MVGTGDSKRRAVQVAVIEAGSRGVGSRVPAATVGRVADLPPPMSEGPSNPAAVETSGAVGADAPAERSGTDFARCVKAGEPFTPFIHPALMKERALIDVEEFSLRYGAARALYSISMPIAEHKVTSLIGPSGCGKSTLLRSINRLNDLIDTVSVTGDMKLGGRSVYAPNVDVIDIRKRIGMVFQKSNPFPMSIFENAVYALRIDGERRRSVLEDACERALRAAALWDEVKDRLKENALGMSGGQQQRLCIARAIAAEPEVLLMDEPCSALDPIATLKVEEFIRSIAGRITVVIVTHNMQQAARVSHNTAFMYLGRLVELGRTADIFQNPRLPETEQYVTGRFG
ncbi:MAG: phosphate ABC transporter ATP-binding protein PstB [Phycisphaerales bacterium]|nr:phosphate ABC transporter ATP-binding protein PstB [Phycisphaerales bacterium]